MIKTIGVAVAASLLLAGCGGVQQPIEQADQCLQAANPQECSQFRDAGGDVSKYLVGGLGGAAAGYMLAKMMTPSGPRYYMQRDPGYHGAFHPIPQYDRSYSYVRQPTYRPYSVRYNRPITAMPTHRVTTTTVTKRSMFGGSKTTTTTSSYRASGYSPSRSYSPSSYSRPSAYSSRSYSSSSYSRPSSSFSSRSYSSSSSRRR